jgi:hypothetical protein
MNSRLALRGGKKWLPVPVGDLEKHLAQLVLPVPEFRSSRCVALRKNVAYSLQHLEFLFRCERDLAVTSVIWTQTAKTFVVVGCSVLEALFYYVLVASGKAAYTEWSSESVTTTPGFLLDGQTYRCRVEHFTKLPAPIRESMTFDAMCKRVEKRHLTRLDSDEFFKHLPYLRSLRNRIHLHSVEDLDDTDWAKFNRNDLVLVQRVLFLFLQSTLFPVKNRPLFYYLDVDAV